MQPYCVQAEWQDYVETGLVFLLMKVGQVVYQIDQPTENNNVSEIHIDSYNVQLKIDIFTPASRKKSK